MDVNPADLVYLHASLTATIRQQAEQIQALQIEIARLAEPVQRSDE